MSKEETPLVHPQEGGHFIRLEDGSLIPDPAYVYKTKEEHDAEQEADAKKAPPVAPAAPVALAVTAKAPVQTKE